MLHNKLYTEGNQVARKLRMFPEFATTTNPYTFTGIYVMCSAVILCTILYMVGLRDQIVSFGELANCNEPWMDYGNFKGYTGYPL